MPVNPCIILFSTSILFIVADLSIPSNTEKVLCKKNKYLKRFFQILLIKLQICVKKFDYTKTFYTLFIYWVNRTIKKGGKV